MRHKPLTSWRNLRPGTAKSRRTTTTPANASSDPNQATSPVNCYLKTATKKKTRSSSSVPSRAESSSADLCLTQSQPASTNTRSRTCLSNCMRLTSMCLCGNWSLLRSRRSLRIRSGSWGLQWTRPRWLNSRGCSPQTLRNRVLGSSRWKVTWKIRTEQRQKVKL